MSTVFQVSNSSLGNTKCDTLAVLSKGLRLTSKDEAAQLKAGSAAHVALAVYAHGGTDKEVLITFDQEYQEWAKSKGLMPSDRLSWENTRKCLEGFLLKRPLETFPFTFVEEWIEKKGVTVPLDNKGEFVYEFRLDGLGKQKGSELPVIVDWKTTGQRVENRYWYGGFDMDSQFSGYPWAMEKILGEMIPTTYIIGIEFSKLPDSNRKCKTHSTTYSECGVYHANHKILTTERTPEQIRSWYKTAIDLAKKLRFLCLNFSDIKLVKHLKTQGTFYNQCKWCEFSEFCKMGRTEDAARVLLVPRED